MVTLAVVLSGTSTASAGPITWGLATNITGNSDIATQGTYVSAINFGPANVTDTNGDLFHAVQTSATGGSPAYLASQNGLATDPITVTIDNIQYGSGSPNTADNNYNAILSYLGYDNGRGVSSTSTVTLNDLTPGHEYLVEFWANQTVGVNANTADISGGPSLNASPTNSGGIPGQFSIGTFYADATHSETFTFTSAGNPVVNAIMVRAVPEPGSFALLGLGAAGLFVVARRRSSSTRCLTTIDQPMSQ